MTDNICLRCKEIIDEDHDEDYCDAQIFYMINSKFDEYKDNILEFFKKSTRKFDKNGIDYDTLHDMYEIWAIKNKKNRIPGSSFHRAFCTLIVSNNNYKSNEYHGVHKQISKNWVLHKGTLLFDNKKPTKTLQKEDIPLKKLTINSPKIKTYADKDEWRGIKHNESKTIWNGYELDECNDGYDSDDGYDSE